MPSTFVKDPGARVDYAVDWLTDGYLSATTPARTITASEWAVEPIEAGGVTITEEAFTAAVASALLGAGIVGHIYQITNRITMDTGAIDERSFLLRIENT
jgi:secreted protein with Ig-like and vWFA domain